MDNELEGENEDENIGKKSQKNLIKRKMSPHGFELTPSSLQGSPLNQLICERACIIVTA
jgi:hypothetical protein